MQQTTYHILLAIAIIGVLVGFGVQMYYEYKHFKNDDETFMFPPWPSVCPDYWESEGNGVCKNVHKIGQCRRSDTNMHMDFNAEDMYTGSDGMYNKCEWSKACEAPWEGVDHLC